MSYEVAGTMFSTRLSAMRAAVDWFVTAGGVTTPGEVTNYTADEIADELLNAGWELPDATDRDELLTLGQYVIDKAQVWATIEALGTDETERLLLEQTNAAEAEIHFQSADDISVADSAGGPHRWLPDEQVADFGRWLRQIS